METIEERFIKVRKELISLILDTVDETKLNTLSLQLGIVMELIIKQKERIKQN